MVYGRSGIECIGQFKNGMRNGVVRFVTSTKEYVGYWENDKMLFMLVEKNNKIKKGKIGIFSIKDFISQVYIFFFKKKFRFSTMIICKSLHVKVMPWHT